MREMPLVLALDCSLRFTAVALLQGDAILWAESEDLGRRQAAELPLRVECLLKEQGLHWEDVGLVALTNGPGYFTGLRVGVAYGAALAYALGVRVVPVSSLEMLAASALGTTSPEGILSVVYAGRGAVYAASFGGPDVLPAGEYDGPTVEAWLSQVGEPVCVVSDDPQRAAESAGLSFPIRAVRPDAASVARLALRDRDRALLPAELRINYHRASH
ncbi:MAG: tRNA (adenosine(37)-N6)-threonylcarbamoyltransferase complex dimerization subunit type 1 TsaB [Fretibacterium sp.]|nr:tRNA (adenosine(37)-N6)-threonylcarbamoyltransferase complex dimerization subunit type 1 TsaB [Fretibacterium sp.]